MRSSRTAIVTSLAATALAAGTALAATPAHASALPSCDTGGSRYVCDLFTAVTSSTWSVDGAHISAFDNKSSISSSCIGGQVYTISVTWTSGGVTQSGSAGFRCSTAPWN